MGHNLTHKEIFCSQIAETVDMLQPAVKGVLFTKERSYSNRATDFQMCFFRNPVARPQSGRCRTAQCSAATTHGQWATAESAPDPATSASSAQVEALLRDAANMLWMQRRGPRKRTESTYHGRLPTGCETCCKLMCLCVSVSVYACVYVCACV